MKKKKITEVPQSSKSEKPGTKEVWESGNEKTQQGNGENGIFSNIPRVHNYDYDDNIKGKV